MNSDETSREWRALVEKRALRIEDQKETFGECCHLQGRREKRYKWSDWRV
jgi:hypothetical protein